MCLCKHKSSPERCAPSGPRCDLQGSGTGVPRILWSTVMFHFWPSTVSEGWFGNTLQYPLRWGKLAAFYQGGSEWGAWNEDLAGVWEVARKGTWERGQERGEGRRRGREKGSGEELRTSRERLRGGTETRKEGWNAGWLIGGLWAWQWKPHNVSFSLFKIRWLLPNIF